MPTVLKSLIAWLPMVPIAVANGIVREALFAPRMSETAAGALSTATLLALLTLYIGWITRRWPARSLREAAMTGAVWAVLTVAFEFGLGAATGASLDAMLADYDITSGRLWSLVPLWMAIAPSLFFGSRRRR